MRSLKDILVVGLWSFLGLSVMLVPLGFASPCLGADYFTVLSDSVSFDGVVSYSDLNSGLSTPSEVYFSEARANLIISKDSAVAQEFSRRFGYTYGDSDIKNNGMGSGYVFYLYRPSYPTGIVEFNLFNYNASTGLILLSSSLSTQRHCYAYVDNRMSFNGDIFETFSPLFDSPSDCFCFLNYYGSYFIYCSFDSLVPNFIRATPFTLDINVLGSTDDNKYYFNFSKSDSTSLYSTSLSRQPISYTDNLTFVNPLRVFDVYSIGTSNFDFIDNQPVLTPPSVSPQSSYPLFYFPLYGDYVSLNSSPIPVYNKYFLNVSSGTTLYSYNFSTYYYGGNVTPVTPTPTSTPTVTPTVTLIPYPTSTSYPGVINPVVSPGLSSALKNITNFSLPTSLKDVFNIPNKSSVKEELLSDENSSSVFWSFKKGILDLIDFFFGTVENVVYPVMDVILSPMNLLKDFFVEILNYVAGFVITVKDYLTPFFVFAPKVISFIPAPIVNIALIFFSFDLFFIFIKYFLPSMIDLGTSTGRLGGKIAGKANSENRKKKGGDD